MKYTKTNPCEDCPFLNKMQKGFTLRRLNEFAQGSFPCHKTATLDDEEDEYTQNDKSVHCAGVLIFLEKRNKPNQMMRISERLGMYDYTKLNMKADVR